MNMESILSCVSENQKKLIRALIDHPEGLMSNELAEITAVSNKSGTMTPEVRGLLEKNGLELSIERNKGKSRWVLREVPTQIVLSRNKLIKLQKALTQLSNACDQIKELVSY